MNTQLSPFTNKPKAKQKTVSSDTVENIKTIGTNISKTVKKDVVSKILEQGLGSIVGNVPRSGELRPNEPIHFHPEVQKSHPNRNKEILNPTRKTEIEQETARNLTVVREEIQKLLQAVQQLHFQVEKAVKETPVQPGVYHVAFYERLRSIIRVLRMNVEESNAWMKLTTKRKQGMAFLTRSKTHGTKFSQSLELKSARAAG